MLVMVFMLYMWVVYVDEFWVLFMYRYWLWLFVLVLKVVWLVVVKGLV